MSHKARDKQDILQQIAEIDPVLYSKTRNFHNGHITRLSPYISRGVVSTSDIFESLSNRGFNTEQCESLVKELCWRDYFNLVWENKGDEMFLDMHRKQPLAENSGIPVAIAEARTGIDAIDHAIRQFYSDGYLHNHMRMYLAMLSCNVARCDWRTPAQWMYYHLRDADAASNTCSWQWVSGAFSHKCYYANQDNINRYFGTRQKNSFLDVSYEELEKIKIPHVLQDLTQPALTTSLPETAEPKLHPEKPILIYHFYNLDPDWHKEMEANRILLLEPEFFKRYPSSPDVMNFVYELASKIPGLQMMHDSFESLYRLAGRRTIIYKAHPTTRHYKGKAEPSRKIFPEVTGYFSSFSKFWRQAEPAFHRAFRS
jgi:deoxyribodipyrimidine photo-lyase